MTVASRVALFRVGDLIVSLSLRLMSRLRSSAYPSNLARTFLTQRREPAIPGEHPREFSVCAHPAYSSPNILFQLSMYWKQARFARVDTPEHKARAREAAPVHAKQLQRPPSSRCANKNRSVGTMQVPTLRRRTSADRF